MAKEQPKFITVDQLRPNSKNVNTIVKVVEAKEVVNRPKGPKGEVLKVSECIVGDQTATIVFTARGDQADLAKPGAYLTLRNAKIDMFRGSMRLAVDKWGVVEAAEEDQSFTPKTDNNLSLIEFELVSVTPGAPVVNI